jgi:tripartite-type tricarboxylate transporter receptor subunit TctC
MPARRAMLPLLALFCAAAIAYSGVASADWPDRAIRWVVPFGPGGANDLIARAAAEAVGKRLGQPIVIENRPGAGTVIGSDVVAKAKPHGYTWLIGSAGVLTNSILRNDMPYADTDLIPVGMIAVAPSVIVVHPNVPANNLKEFVAWAKTKGGSINWATAGGGSTPHFVAEMLREAGVNITIIPYKSGSEGMTAVLSNNVDATSEASIVVLPQVKTGKLKAIATTYSKRISAYDSLSTAQEQGFPGVLIGHWAGLFAPRGTPPAIVERMSRELEVAVRSPEFRDKMVPSGIEPEPGTTANFIAFIDAERDRLRTLAKKANMQADK